MLSYDYILAAVLLTSPIESTTTAAHVELLQPAILALALDAEILDPREEPLLQGMSKDAVGDVAVLRKRFDALANAPMLAECACFPERKVVEDFLTFNRDYRRYLLAQLETDAVRAEELRTALQELDQRFHLWSTVRDARCTFYYVTVRRQALQQIRDLVGSEAYYRGQMPPHVPIWHFPRLR